MKCEEVEGLMMDYLDNKLEPEQVTMIEKHLGTCEKCLDNLKDLQELIQLMSKEEFKRPDESMRTQFLPHAT